VFSNLAVQTFLIQNYTKVTNRKKRPFPLVKVGITANNKEEFVEALADTGYDGTLVISAKKATEIGLKKADRKNKSGPYKLTAANGAKINTDIYKKMISIGSIKSEAFFYVAYNNVPLIWSGIFGRTLMDSYKVLFDEESNPKRIMITKG